jgi:AcrR family transcriptional regulator
MKDRRDAILDVAISLAEEGGFDNVRQRDVAAHAGVALGTLYKRFRSKEDILVAALDRETETLERRMEAKPATGATPLDRVVLLFQIVTRGMCKKPKYARAVLRAVASGEPEVAGKVAAYQDRMTGLIIAALRGVGKLGVKDAASPAAAKAPSQLTSKAEKTLAFALQQIWFASLVGWSAGLLSQAQVVEQMRLTGAILMRGVEGET